MDARQIGGHQFACESIVRPPALGDQLETELDGRDFIFGAYTIADMAMYPHVMQQREKLSAFPNVARWEHRMRLRPEVGRGMGAVSR